MSKNLAILLKIVGISLIIFSSSLNLVKERYYLLNLAYFRYGMFFLGAFILMIFRNIKKTKISLYILILLWIIFSSITILSQLVNNMLPLQGFFNLIFIPLVYFIIIDYNKIKVNYILQAFVITGTFWIIFSYFQIYSYYTIVSSVFVNPNSFAQITGISSLSSLLLFGQYIKLDKKKLGLLFLLIFIALFYVTILTESRTVIIAVIICVLFFIAFSIKTFKTKRLLYFIPILIISMILFRNEILLILGSIFSDSEFGLLSGREDFWNYIIKLRVSVIGYGTYGTDLARGAHNTFLQVLYFYGVLGLIVYLTILILLILRLVKRYTRDNNKYIFLVLIIFYLLISLTEDVFGSIGKSATVLFFLIYGASISSHKGLKQKYEDD